MAALTPINLREIRKICFIFINQGRIVTFAVLYIKNYCHPNGTKTKVFFFFQKWGWQSPKEILSQLEAKIFRVLTSPIQTADRLFIDI